MAADIITNLVASLIWFFFGLLVYRSIRAFNLVIPIKRLWNIHNPKELIICAATSTRTDTGDYLRPATGVGQVRALGYSIESLSQAYDLRIQNILLSDDQVQKQIEKDFIVLGGPKNNVVARLFLDKLKSNQAVVDQEGSVIKWLVSGSEEDYLGTKKDKKIVEDYGFIIRANNPFASPVMPTTVCIFSGCHTYGTIAAAKYFTRSYLKKMKGLHLDSPNVALLVKCDVVNGFPVAIDLIKEYEF